MSIESSLRWDHYFQRLARDVAAKSKDPSTQCGAVIADPKQRLVSVGYNGFARGVVDSPERYADRSTKLRMVIHAETNALLFAQRDLEGCTLYTWPFQPCAQCAALVIQAGIVRVVAPPPSADILGRWALDIDLAQQMFREAGVLLDLMEVDHANT